jgi:hypothetical protein
MKVKKYTGTKSAHSFQSTSQTKGKTHLKNCAPIILNSVFCIRTHDMAGASAYYQGRLYRDAYAYKHLSAISNTMCIS